jgi:hypothetical protein
MPSITLTVLAGPAAGSSCTREDSSKPFRVGRVKNGNALVVKDGKVFGLYDGWSCQKECTS